MQETSKLKEAIGAADAVLGRKAKIEAAITAELAKLPNLIDTRLETEAEFRRLECQAAIGEPAPGLEKMRKEAAEARGALDQASLRLGGLRANLAATGVDLVPAYDAIKGEIPSHEAALIQAFKEEWAAACSALALTLGRRIELERLTGRRLDMPEPTAAPADLGDAGVPHARVTALAAALDHLARIKRQSRMRQDVSFLGRPSTPYDRAAIYVLEKDSDGMTAGSRVVDASFNDGVLDGLVALDRARVFNPLEVSPGALAAERKHEQIEREAKAKREQDEQEESLRRAGVTPQHTRRYDLEREAEQKYAGMENDPKRKRNEDSAAARVPIGHLEVSK